ncbi:hypothetical protein F5883DRAFT_563776 [Diaporthe sp. PMI_573]|nr:hypothetical protein F5883DRAFT_563776 [Diaporthaceae sp. PMI_573]
MLFAVASIIFGSLASLPLDAVAPFDGFGHEMSRAVAADLFPGAINCPCTTTRTCGCGSGSKAYCSKNKVCGCPGGDCVVSAPPKFAPSLCSS